MSDAQDIENAMRTIDALYQGDLPAHVCDFPTLLADTRDCFDDVGDALATLNASGEWACNVALHRYRSECK